MTTIPSDAQSIAALLAGAADSPVIRGGVLILARLAPIAAITPLLGGTTAPARFRFGVALLLSAVFAPCFPSPVDPRSPMLALVTTQAIIGLSMALAIRFVFEIYAAAGRLIDDARGAGNAELFDPFNNQQQQSQLGAFLTIAAIAVFAASDGHAAFLSAFIDGLVVAPPSSFLPTNAIGPASSAWFMSLAGELVVAAVKLAAPVLAVTLLIDLALGLVNRLAPQIQATNLGLIMKGAAAIAALSFSLALAFTSPARAVVSAVTSWLRSVV